MEKRNLAKKIMAVVLTAALSAGGPINVFAEINDFQEIIEAEDPGIVSENTEETEADKEVSEPENVVTTEDPNSLIEDVVETEENASDDPVTGEQSDSDTAEDDIIESNDDNNETIQDVNELAAEEMSEFSETENLDKTEENAEESTLEVGFDDFTVYVKGLFPENSYITVDRVDDTENISSLICERIEKDKEFNLLSVFNIHAFTGNDEDITGSITDNPVEITVSGLNVEDAENIVIYEKHEENIDDRYETIINDIEAKDKYNDKVVFEPGAIHTFIIGEVKTKELIDTTVEATTGDTKVQVEGIMPENSYITVEPVENITNIENIIKENGEPGFKFTVQKAYDICLFDENGEEYQPVDNDATVTVTIEDPELENIENPQVRRIEDNNDEVTDMNVTEITDNSVTFETEHFTIYVIGEDTYNTDDLGIIKQIESDGITWTLYDNGLLVATGDGRLNSAPSGGLVGTNMFVNEKDQIENVVLDCVLYKKCYALFSSLTSLKTLTTGDNFSSTYTENMNRTFVNCSSLTSIDLSHFDTSNCKRMWATFSGCSSLTSLDLSSFDTSSAEDMSSMFSDCSSLTSLDLSGFVINASAMGTDDGCMESMFSGCNTLKEIKAPKTIPYKRYITDTIELPEVEGASWYLDDDNDLEADNDTVYTQLIVGITDEPHTYIRNDIEGFSKPEMPATLISGSDINTALKNLKADATEIRFVKEDAPDDTEGLVNIAVDESEPVYAGIDGNAIKITADADVIYLNSNMSDAFKDMQTLEIIDMGITSAQNTNSFDSMLAGCSSLVRFITPTNLPDGVDITFPEKNGTGWFVDDEDPEGEPDNETVCSTVGIFNDNASHTFIRSSAAAVRNVRVEFVDTFDGSPSYLYSVYKSKTNGNRCGSIIKVIDVDTGEVLQEGTDWIGVIKHDEDFAPSEGNNIASMLYISVIPANEGDLFIQE